MPVRKKNKTFSAYASAVVTYEFTCPECKKNVMVTGQFHEVGGCTGHVEGDYCYCDSAHLEEDVICPNCGAAGELRVA